MTENTAPGQMHFGLWKNYQLLVRKVIDIFCCPFCCLQEGLPKYNHAFLSKTATKITVLALLVNRSIVFNLKILSSR